MSDRRVLRRGQVSVRDLLEDLITDAPSEPMGYCYDFVHSRGREWPCVAEPAITSTFPGLWPGQTDSYLLRCYGALNLVEPET